MLSLPFISSAFGMLEFYEKMVGERKKIQGEEKEAELAPKRRKLDDGSYITEAAYKINR